MTVQELIDELMKIPEEDRNCRLMEHAGDYTLKEVPRMWFMAEKVSWGINRSEDVYTLMEMD